MTVARWVIAAVGFVNLAMVLSGLRSSPRSFVVRFAAVSLAAVAAGTVVGGEGGFALALAGTIVQFALVAEAAAATRAAVRRSGPGPQRRAARLLDLAHWPARTPAAQQLRLAALDLEGRFDEMAAMAAIAATARTGVGHLDAKGRVALSPWLPWTPDVGREAIALLESGFRANAETAMRAAVRTDPARCLDLARPHLLWLLDRRRLGVVLPLLAAAGRLDATRLLLDLLPANPEARASWLVTASAATGNGPAFEIARHELASIGTPRAERLSAGFRSTVAQAPVLDAAQHEVLDRIESFVRRVSSIHAPQARRRFPLLTAALVAGCLAGYAVELRNGGPSDEQGLIRSGAVVIRDGHLVGAWWRVLTAAFLHGGLLHLASNLVVLVALGTTVERRFGPLRLAVLWASGTVGGTIAAAAFSASPTSVALPGAPVEEVLVGASTAIMAFVGGLLVWSALLWIRDRNPAARPMVLRIVAAVVAQTAIDQLVPQISGAGHLGGLAAGIVAMLLAEGAARRRPR